MTIKKRQIRNLGDIVKIDLEDGFHAYARVLEEAMFAFYDCRTKEDLGIEQVAAAPVLFQIAVMDHAVKRGRWPVVGHLPLDSKLAAPPPRFIQDVNRPDSFSIYQHGIIHPATKEECRGLERAAVWDPTHVEDRLRDHYAGRKNKWFESMRIKE